ncbi:MAG TPA: flagellar basal body P-ring formation chaperone FlgA [Thiobacillus sp.]|nr:MAG: flagella basal body P-ring formation protein FlgA [Hydrogenophilales bacterium 28-61-11]OYZ57773.1 MAG: flagella basal body P-ring formation protein FlgA [Hydrogenophilales bacterium 16-61-112]HQT31290.1 flagellar basal body P-ring formation chaperone FlgA [Thiobacillus sp.]HQT69865.1 flagellar basal body P-ring formation chaperone FlgA [Thiobacillus sp.]
MPYPSTQAVRAACGQAALIGLCLTGTAQAGSQDPAALQAHAERFLKTQANGLPGTLSVSVKPPRSTFEACDALEAFQPPGSRAIGKTTVGVRCLAPSKWTVYLPAQVKLIGRYVATSQPLPANHVLIASDLMLREGDLGLLTPDVASDVDAIVGYRTVSGLAANAPLRASLLRSPLVVQQGQPTRIVLNGPGFTVQSEGQALANGSRGDRIRVKTASGQVVSGVAQDGQQVIVAY